MSFKIIFSDIDGTFLTDDKRVTDLTANAARTIIANGLKFVLVSARMAEAIYPIIDSVGLPPIPLVCYSGALVLSDSDRVLLDIKISPTDSYNLLSTISSRWSDFSLNFYSGRSWFVPAIDERIQHEIDITQASANLANLSDLLDNNIFPNKFMIIADPSLCEDMQRVLSNLFVNLNVVRSAPHLLEIMDNSVSKAVGINVLLNFLNLSVSDAIAFGDNFNDLDMLNFIPHSVAMANAPDPVKSVAHALTDSNNDSGIFFLDLFGWAGGF